MSTRPKFVLYILFLFALTLALASPASAAAEEILLAEIVVTPTGGEFVEIHNPTAATVDLSDYYLTDATFAGGGTYYYNIVTGTNAGGGGFADFHARFPDGATIASGEYQTIAMAGSEAFAVEYGVNPNYELFEDGASPDGVPDMREALPDSIDGQGGLTNSGEVVVLYFWDGETDLVTDVDYALWGDKDEAVDKTGVSIDGPDADSDTSPYLADTSIASQDVLDSGDHSFGNSWQRDDLAEGTELASGGNGVNGEDETSENLSETWCESEPTPGEASSCPVEPPILPRIVVNEIMQNPAAVNDSDGEWFELYNAETEAVDVNGWTIRDDDFDSHVINNGAALEIPAFGYLVLGRNGDTGTNGGVTVDYEYVSDWALGNGADEIVLLDGNEFEVDRVEYDGGFTFPDPSGASMALTDSTLDNNVGANWCVSGPSFGDGDLGTPGTANECRAPQAATIHEVQGAGGSVALTGLVSVEAVVVGDYQDNDRLSGFFIQEEDADVDGDVNTSEGIFVFCGGCGTGVVVGDLVHVTGLAEDFFGMSQIDVTGAGGAVSVASSGNALPTPATIDLPADGSTEAEGTFENVEGMLVTFTDELFVSEYFELARYGQLVLTANGRPSQFTNANEPSVAGYPAFLDDLNSKRIILDDDNNIQNDAIEGSVDEPYYWPRPGLSISNRIRGGDSISNLTGVLHWSFAGQFGTDAWRVRPVDHPEIEYDFTQNNEHPSAPDDVGGSLKVASFNVLNYFTTIDDGQALCGPPGFEQGCRGADSEEELERQRAKIVAALEAMDADVVGLIEIQNDEGASVADLVSALNNELGTDIYAYVDTGFIGTDAIKVAFIYKTESVGLVGDYAILDSSVDARFNDDKNRPALAQTFEEKATGGVLTVVVNHLKSKGSDCDDLGDPDIGDGQGNCNLTRTEAAQAMVDWLATDPTGSGDADFLITGDLNAYRNEDPIDAIEAGADDVTGSPDDYTDLLDLLIGPSAYTYLFDGQLGYLDHALANDNLLDQVTGVTAWHINADEIPVFDYNDGIEDAGERSFDRESTALDIYEGNAFRASDHDPVIVGLDLNASPDCSEAYASEPMLWPPNHKFEAIDVLGVTDAEGDALTFMIDGIFQDEAVDAPNSGDTAPDGRIVDGDTVEVRAERIEDGNGRVYHIFFTVTDSAGGSCSGEALVHVPNSLGKNQDAVDDGALFDSTVVP